MQLRPEGAEGTYRIGPYELDYEGQKIVSNAVDVQVTRKVESSAAAPVFLKASLNREKVWFGEQFFYVLRIYRRQTNEFSLSDFQLGLPEFPDLISDQQNARQTEGQDFIDGVLYQMTEVRVPVFAARHGKIEIPPAQVSYRIARRGQGGRGGPFSFFNDDFFSFGQRGTQEQAYSEAVDLEVQALPKPEPEGFSGLVGLFKVEALLDKRDLKVGDGATLTLRVEGIGSLQDFSGFNFEHEKFRVYEDGDGLFEPRRTQEGFLGGVKTFKYAVVPKESGVFKLDPFKLIYFDPDKREYVSCLTDELRLEVAPGEAEDFVFVGGDNADLRPREKKSLKIQGQDIFPIRLRYDEDNFFHLSLRQWFFLFLLPVLIAGGMEFLRHRSSFYAKNPLEYARANAWQIYLREKSQKADSPGGLLLRLIQRKLGVPVKALTSQELERFLHEREQLLSADLKESILKHFREDEFLRYTGKPADNEKVFTELALRVQKEMR
jgi:hypothetical protein